MSRVVLISRAACQYFLLTTQRCASINLIGKSAKKYNRWNNLRKVCPIDATKNEARVVLSWNPSEGFCVMLWFSPPAADFLDCKFEISGIYIAGVTPLPIPNREVKPPGADGTMWVTAWESRSMPDFFLNPVLRK